MQPPPLSEKEVAVLEYGSRARTRMVATGEPAVAVVGSVEKISCVAEAAATAIIFVPIAFLFICKIGVDS